MDDEQAFLNAIAADPDDDTPRLVFADWLQEHGHDDRAEFIRVQCRLARSGPADPGWHEGERRERELLALHGPRWRGELPDLIPGWRWGRFRRGFVDELIAGASAGPAGLPDLDGVPPIGRLTVSPMSPRGWVAALRWRALEKIRELDLGGHGVLDDLVVTAGSEVFGRLLRLRLRSGGQLQVGRGRFLGAFPRLRALEIVGGGWTLADLLALLDAEGTPGLAELSLLGVRLPYLDGSRAANPSPPLVSGNLERLTLSGCNIRPGTIERLTPDLLPRLTALDLTNNPLGNRGLSVLASSGIVGQLTELAIPGCDVSYPGLDALLRWVGDGLRVLRIDTNISRPAARLLAGAKKLERLAALEVVGHGRPDVRDILRAGFGDRFHEVGHD